MMKRLILLALLVLTFGLSSVLTAQADVPADGDAVAYAVLFYSPTCPHCHKVINDDLPVFEAEFGDALQVLMVDVTTQSGNILFLETCDVLDSAGRCGGVPMMAVGTRLLFGSQQIPDELPGIVREGLAAGGIALPPVQMLRDAYAAQSTSNPANAATATDEERVLQSEATSQSLLDRLNNDLVANVIAIGVLLALLASVVLVITAGRVGLPDRLAQGALWASAGISLIIVMTLIAESADDTLAQLIAWGVLILLALAAMLVVVAYPRPHIVPLVALAGLAVALYLTRIETTNIEATCGAIGNCNAVQQSEYAQLFGVLPVGVLGAVGYVLILMAWLLTQISRVDVQTQRYAQVGLLVLALFGAAFSIYLTFLEPFVIGATCAWCLTSALTILLLLWLVAPAGWEAYYALTKTATPRSQQQHL